MMRCGLPAILLMLAAGPAMAGHGIDGREQWQPQAAREPDPRLAQPVEIEVLGRAAVPALEMLSEETGVALRVAPENIETIGERKLTIIAQGCSLKTIMVQISNALRECHWDIDARGEAPVYLLHRNAGARATMAELRRRDHPAPSEALRAHRIARIEAARRALSMTSKQLDRLERSDILLARAARDRISRPAIESLFALPEDKMNLLLDTGQVEVAFREASEWLQEIARTDLRLNWTEDLPWEEGEEPPPDALEEVLSSVRFTFVFACEGVDVSCRCGSREWLVAVAVPPPAYPPGCEALGAQLLFRTGTPKAEAEEIVRRLAEGWQEWKPPEPEFELLDRSDGDLVDALSIDCADSLDFVEVQRTIARATGMSVISDYFTLGPWQVPEKVREGLPMAQLLDELCTATEYEWQLIGNCLVFNHAMWYDMVPGEVPDSLLAPYRHKLEAGEDLLPRELIAIASEMQRTRSHERDPATPDERRSSQLLDSFARWAFDFCGSTADYQAEALFAPAGLPFAEMNGDQQARFLAEIRLWAVAEEAAQSPDLLALHIRAETHDCEGTLEGGVRAHVSFRGKGSGGTSVSFRLPYPPARCPGGSPTE